MKTLFYKDQGLDLSQAEFDKLSQLIPTVTAGGGIVRSAHDRILLIFRKGKWDLPKGKLEPGESIELCAMREVEEETGVSSLNIIKPLPDTYHLFGNTNNLVAIKRCCWFEMRCKGEPLTIAQHEEDIETAIWVDKEDLPAYFKTMYPTVSYLIRYYLNATSEKRQ